MAGYFRCWRRSGAYGTCICLTVAGEELVFWPRIPKETTTVEYASAEQGTKRGDAAIAWQFRNIEKDKSAQVVIRIVVPPSSKATLKLDASAKKVTIKSAVSIPDLEAAKEKATAKCSERRASSKYGFPFFYHYDRFKEQWTKINQAQKTGTICDSFLWELGSDKLDDGDEALEWSSYEWEPTDPTMPKQALQPGLFEVIIEDWPLGPRIPELYHNYNISEMPPYCADETQYKWDMNDALHLV
ncbi:MAG: hypothetical protein SGARI_004104 [Bacillariaceae sp.]